MSDEQQPKIIFPCAYPLRVVGNSAPDFQQFVVSIIKKHVPDFDGKSTYKKSSSGNYESIFLSITATGEAQLKDIFNELKSSRRIQLVI